MVKAFSLLCLLAVVLSVNANVGDKCTNPFDDEGICVAGAVCTSGKKMKGAHGCDDGETCCTGGAQVTTATESPDLFPEPKANFPSNYVFILSDSEGAGLGDRPDRMKRTLQLRDALRNEGMPKDHIVVFSTDPVDCKVTKTLARIQDCSPFQFTGADASFTKLKQEITKLPKDSHVFVVMEVHGMHNGKKGDVAVKAGGTLVVKPQAPYIKGGCLSMTHTALGKTTSADNQWCSDDFNSFMAEMQDKMQLIVWTGACYGSSLYNYEYPYLSISDTKQTFDDRNVNPKNDGHNLLFVGMKDNRSTTSGKEDVILGELLASLEDRQTIQDAVAGVKHKEKKDKKGKSNKVEYKGKLYRAYNIDDGNRINAFGDVKLYQQSLHDFLIPK